MRPLKRSAAFSFIFLLAVHFSTVSAQEADWELRKNEAGIQVFTREVETSNLDAFKAEATINNTVQSLISTFQDLNSFYTWMPDCEQAELISFDGTKQYHYVEIYAPFPVSNRDGCYLFEYEQQGENMKINISAVPELKPKVDGMVRVPFSKGYWLLEKLNDKQTKLTYTAIADPGGAIPAWLANSAVVSNPYDTMKNLKELLDQ